ncbi:allantoinase AllB [Ferruginibacter sp. SUN002]|uniref:allantoinase AllB n=1 Tax=Ferruginibacter sp. SUN002 TaxID=2937789 RepID=UPI003D363371
MLAIKTDRIVLPGGIKKGVVLISKGMIVDVVDELPEGNDHELIDVGNKIVMPGVIDPHVHINEPGRTDWEGFNTATRAAIAGGLTTLVDMPLNSSPVTTTVDAFERKLAATQNKLHTNVGFWGGVIPGNDKELEGLIEKGVLGFKAFLTHSGIDDFPNATEEDLRKAMPIIAKHKLPLLVHCELSIDNGLWTTDNGRSYQNYLSSRPKKWEDDAISMMIRLSEEFNCHVHIVHLSSANSVAQIVEAKQKGLPITVESGQHYLYFNAEEIPDGQTQFKCAPPIREKANNDLLWKALGDGVIDLVATDHSPATPDLKELRTGDFMKAWGGIASLQFALPVLLTAAKKRNYTIEDVVKWLCEHPAKLIGKEHNRGKIAKGFIADIIIVDDEKTFTVTEEIIHHKHKVTPYLGRELSGVVEQTYLGGAKVYDNGRFIELNKGKIILA